MEQQERNLLEENGFDVDGTMRRFLNNENLYKQCLKKFLNDNSMEKLRNAIASNDCKEAFQAAHTMKGFVSNLGMNRLYDAVIPIVEKLRAQNLLITEEMDRLETVYRETCQLIEKL